MRAAASLRILGLAVAVGAVLMLLLLPKRPTRATEGPVEISYWDKWNGTEAESIKALVDDFNASQNRIRVKYLPVSQLDRKLMLATAGGVPPDVSGLWSLYLPVYAENNALTPLDKFAAESGLSEEDYVKVIWNLCRHRDHLWALPITASSIALVWNKKLFREAGLDPEQPPRSIRELEEFNEKLVKRRADGSIERIGFLPEDPGWWSYGWGFWFGGELWDGVGKATIASPENVRAFEWLASYSKRFGKDNLLQFRSSFGMYASPQNAFLAGQVAMTIQGMWVQHYIEMYGPKDFEWGVAPFPSEDPEKHSNVSIVESDVLVIPAGSRHPKEAWEFIRYVNSQKAMEKMCIAAKRFSCLSTYSDEFVANNKHPYWKEYLELAKSPNAHFVPRLTFWNQYNNDIKTAIGSIWLGSREPYEALLEAQERGQEVMDRRRARWERVSEKLREEWSKQ